MANSRLKSYSKFLIILKLTIKLSFSVNLISFDYHFILAPLRFLRLTKINISPCENVLRIPYFADYLFSFFVNLRANWSVLDFVVI